MTLEKRLRQPTQAGKVLKPPADFTGMSPNPKGDMWEWVKRPDGLYSLRNKWTPGVGDGHATLTTPRDLGLGLTAADALDCLYRLPTDLQQIGRNLVWQVQMEDSPVFAWSTEAKTDHWSFVERINGTEHRHDLGPIDFGRDTFLATHYRLADKGGFVEVWFAYDRMPDVATRGLMRFEGDTWQDGRNAHNTIGQYAKGTKVPTLADFTYYARAATPAKAIELAMAA